MAKVAQGRPGGHFGVRAKGRVFLHLISECGAHGIGTGDTVGYDDEVLTPAVREGVLLWRRAGGGSDESDRAMTHRSGTESSGRKSVPDPPGAADEARRTVEELVRLQLAALAALPALLRQWTDIVAACGEEVSRSLSAARDPNAAPAAMAAMLQSYVRCLEQMTRLPRIHGLRVLSELGRLRSQAAAAGSASPSGPASPPTDAPRQGAVVDAKP